MAKDLNKVQIIGRLGADPEMKFLATGKAVTNFTVACGRQWTTDGEKHEETEWFRVVAWDKLGEICNQYLTKGARVYIEGRQRTEKYTDREGIERFTVKLIASDMIMLDTKKAERHDDEGDDAPDDAPAAPPPPRTAPAHRAPVASARAVSRNQPQPIESDDDIPF